MIGGEIVTDASAHPLLDTPWATRDWRTIVQHLLGSRSQRVTLLPVAPFMTAGAVLAVVALR